MTLQNFIARLNWRQILLHSIAFWFFIHAFQTLSYLYDTKLIDTIRQSRGQLTNSYLANNKIEASDLTYFLLWTSVSGFVGLLTAFTVSLTISIKRHWFLVNAILVFFLTYVLYRFDLLGWTYSKQFFWYLGQRFNNSAIEFIFNGIILLTIGILIFFLRRPNQFIENKNLATG
jgi:hypothetical protein